MQPREGLHKSINIQAAFCKLGHLQALFLESNHLSHIVEIIVFSEEQYSQENAGASEDVLCVTKAELNCLGEQFR